MAVRGLEKFLDYFADCKSSFAVIGGCACSQWCAETLLATIRDYFKLQ